MAKTVLIVDDEADVCDLLKLTLEKRGLVVQTASDGQEALDQIEGGRPPDLILLDLKMPRLSGYQLFARLKSDEKLRTIPIIVITGLTQDSGREDTEWAQRMGAEGFLTKPFELDELGRRVEEMVSKFL